MQTQVEPEVFNFAAKRYQEHADREMLLYRPPSLEHSYRTVGEFGSGKIVLCNAEGCCAEFWIARNTEGKIIGWID
jgi:hypothetical protein